MTHNLDLFSLSFDRRRRHVDIWEQVLKRKHALDKGNAILPVHGNEIRQCTSEFDVNCTIM